MKIRTKAGKLVSTGNFSNISFSAEIEFECEPKNYDELSERFAKAFAIVNQQVEKQIAESIEGRKPVVFNDDSEVPF